MEKIWNTISMFFTETIPSFAKANWVVLLIVFASVSLVLLVSLIVALVAKKRQHARTQNQIMELVSKNTERVKQIEKQESEYKALNEKYIESVSECKKLEEVTAERCENARKENAEEISSLKKDLDLCKETLADRELQLSAVSKDNQDKDSKIANMVIEADNKSIELSTLKNNYESLKCEKDEVVADFNLCKGELGALEEVYNDLSKKYNELYDKNNKTEASLVSLTDEHNTLEAKYRDALKEIDFLKTYELENEILLKTIRKFREDDISTQANMTDAIASLEKRLNTKIENTFESMTAKVIAAKAKEYKIDFDNLDTLKRNELSKIARKLGIKNYATWTNEKLLVEIRKYKN